MKQCAEKAPTDRSAQRTHILFTWPPKVWPKCGQRDNRREVSTSDRLGRKNTLSPVNSPHLQRPPRPPLPQKTTPPTNSPNTEYLCCITPPPGHSPTGPPGVEAGSVPTRNAPGAIAILHLSPFHKQACYREFLIRPVPSAKQIAVAHCIVSKMAICWLVD